VDRATLALAFRNVGLEWDDCYCESVDKQYTSAVVEITPPQLHEEMPVRRQVAPIWAFACVTGVVAIAVWFAQVQYRAYKQRVLFGEFTDLFAATDAAYTAGDYPKARRLLQETERMSQTIDSAGSHASVQQLGARLAAVEGNDLEAIRRYQLAIGFRESAHTEVCVTALCEQVSEIEIRQGLFDDARAHLKRSLKGYQAMKDPVGIGLVYRDLGKLAYKQHDLDEATRLYDLSLDTVRGHHKPDIEADVHASQAMVLCDKGQQQTAKMLLEHSLQYWKDQHHQRWIAVTEGQLGKVAVSEGNVHLAQQLYTQAMHGFNGVGDAIGALECEQALARLSRSITQHR